VLNINKKRAIPLTISIYIRRDSTTAVVGGGIDSRDITWKSKKKQHLRTNVSLNRKKEEKKLTTRKK